MITKKEKLSFNIFSLILLTYGLSLAIVLPLNLATLPIEQEIHLTKIITITTFVILTTVIIYGYKTKKYYIKNFIVLLIVLLFQTILIYTKYN